MMGEIVIVSLVVVAAAVLVGWQFLGSVRARSGPSRCRGCTQACGSEGAGELRRGDARARRHLPISLCSLTLAAACLLAPGEGAAADTVETWDVGATDVEFSVALDGVGPSSAEREHSAVMLLGYGIVERLSAYLGTTLQGDEQFSNGRADVHLGVFGTLVETDHFDLDLFLAASTLGSSALEVCPSGELNFDLDPERRSWGTYLRFGLPIGGSEDPEATEPRATLSITVNPGTYLTVADGHQILLEADLAFPQQADADRSLDLGGLAAGYNAKLDDSIELVNQVFVDLPQRDEALSFGLMVGFIATMPSPRAPTGQTALRTASLQPR